MKKWTDEDLQSNIVRLLQLKYNLNEGLCFPDSLKKAITSY